MYSSTILIIIHDILYNMIDNGCTMHTRKDFIKFNIFFLNNFIWYYDVFITKDYFSHYTLTFLKINGVKTITIEVVGTEKDTYYLMLR